ncbi:DUF4198 domain-containing protein [Pseudomonas sp. 21LCFQ02]|uniref:DUF4198 domain-containing protein n=1 Tax=Pseudomonas sp. 21LCFQ02 TaxID=2957505 RepID=UPI00209B9AB9|nr:DUF4198 domain-containing protein [Pseudomonas sp. 21LCFQ02]MCO8169872.1 DUF4198 domain-containing protein [Pseudomonas sp. 21LCFQ02]
MRLKPSLLALSLIGSTLFTAQASAHGLWTEQRRGNIEVVFGEGAEDTAYKPAQVTAGWAWDKTGKPVAVTIEPQADHARLKPAGEAAAVAAELDLGVYTKGKDGKWVNQPLSKVPGGSDAVQARKYSLAINDHVKLPALDALKLVIVPQADPLEIGVGKPLPVKVLLDGKPAAGIKLIPDYRSAPDETSGETDAQGNAQVVVRNAGLNVIAAQTSVEVKGNADYSKRALFSSLTFVGEEHHD